MGEDKEPSKQRKHDDTTRKGEEPREQTRSRDSFTGDADNPQICRGMD
jgi:hypothetical protein